MAILLRGVAPGEQYMMRLEVRFETRVVSQVHKPPFVPWIRHAMAGPVDLAILEVRRQCEWQNPIRLNIRFHWGNKHAIRSRGNADTDFRSCGGAFEREAVGFDMLQELQCLG